MKKLINIEIPGNFHSNTELVQLALASSPGLRGEEGRGGKACMVLTACECVSILQILKNRYVRIVFVSLVPRPSIPVATRRC